MDINEIYLRYKYLANKSGYLSYISPDDFNGVWRASELKYFNRLYSQYDSIQKNSDSLSKFESDLQVIAVDSQGHYANPADLLHVSALTYSLSGKQVEITRVEKDRLANNLSSSYDAPTPEFPIYVQYANYLQFYPINIGSANLTYLKRPIAGKWGYTMVSERPVYDSTTSVQPLWQDTDINIIIDIALSDAGINMRDNELQNYSQLTQKQDN